MFLMIMYKRTIRKLGKYWLIWRFSKCRNGNKGMCLLIKFGRGFMILQSGIHKLKLKSKILLRAVWTLMVVKLLQDLRISFNKNYKHIRLNCPCWWLRKWVKLNKWLRNLLKYSTFQKNKISYSNNMVSISKVITTFCPKIRPCKTKRFKSKICRVNSKSYKAPSTLTMQENFNYWRKNILFCRVKSKRQVKLLTQKEHKWSKSLRNNLMLCQNQSKLMSLDWWKTTLWTKIVLHKKHWNNVKEWRKRLQY